MNLDQEFSVLYRFCLNVIMIWMFITFIRLFIYFYLWFLLEFIFSSYVCMIFFKTWSVFIMFNINVIKFGEKTKQNVTRIINYNNVSEVSFNK